MGSLESSNLERCLIYLVDNDSTDGSVAFVEEHFPDVRIIRHTDNLGYAAAYNESASIAFNDGCDWLCLLNTDTLVSEDWLDAIFAAAGLDSSIGIMGPVFAEWGSNEPNFLMRSRHPELLDTLHDRSQPPVDTDWVEGSVFFVSRDCFQRLGGFDPIFFMYWEEADLCRNAKLHGFRVVIVRGSVCRHFAGGTTGSENVYNRLKIRNHLVYKMIDPERGFLPNMLSAFRLYLSYCRIHFRQLDGVGNLVEFSSILISWVGMIPACYRSWSSKRNNP